VEATDSGLTRHEGREYGVVLSGALHVEVGFDSTILQAGDSLSFDSMIPHRFRNASNSETRAVWFVKEPPGGTATGHSQGASGEQFWNEILEQHAD
jgi:quercetin dioxygenase-like cupin family protein